MAPSSSPKACVESLERLPSPPRKKFRSMDDIMKRAKHVATERDDDVYSQLMCEKCGEGDREEEMLLCDGCDKGYHMLCARPIVPRVPIGSWYCSACSGSYRLPPIHSLSQSKIIDFFRIHKCDKMSDKCLVPQVSSVMESNAMPTIRSSPQSFYNDKKDTKRRRRRSSVLVVQKKRRRLLPFLPTEDHAQRLVQMRSLAYALTAMKVEFSDELTYMSGMAPRSANQAEYEDGGMQVLSREDLETLERCKAMCRRGEGPPLLVVFDSLEGFTVQADGLIKDMTIISEYTGDVDYNKNRESDDCDSIMCLLLAKDPSDSLVICPDRRGNIARFISGINNHDPESRKKQNLKCLRYNVDGECRVLLVATRDIAKGERLYYDYNGYMYEYPTHHFV